jgi:hypothetical protein
MFPLITATVGAAFGVYAEHDLGPVCWVSDYPRGCEADSSVACLSPLIGWLFGGGVMVFALVAILVNNCLIFRHVQTTARRTNATTFYNVHRRFNETQTTSRQPPRRNNQKVRAVAVQGAMYVATGLFCYFPTVLLRAIEAVQPDNLGGSPEGPLYVLFVMQAVFLPSQNSIITLIFIRPRYYKCRFACPDKSRQWAFRYALLGGEIFRESSTFPLSQNNSQIRASSTLFDQTKTTSQRKIDEESTAHPTNAHTEDPSDSLARLP